MKRIAIAFLALSSALLAAASVQAAAERPEITGIEVSRSRTRDFAPERSFVLNRGDRLYSYQIRLHFRTASPLSVDFQTFSCEADRKTDKPFRFSYLNQTVRAGQRVSDPYYLIVPFDDVGAVVCMVGPWRPLKTGRSR
jgi:hypothetical protein